MIIQIRGTSGSGKSTVMRRVMTALVGNSSLPWTPETIDTRKNPLYYERNGVVVLGHYESPCGGCDTIGSAPQIFELIQKLEDKRLHDPVKKHGGCDYLCEGLLLSEDVKWSSQLPDLRVIFLTTSLDQCLQNIQKRRAEKGNDKPLNPHNTENRVAVIERARLKLIEAGIICRRANSEQAVDIILNWLK